MQICMSRMIECHAIQSSAQLASALASNLGIESNGANAEGGNVSSDAACGGSGEPGVEGNNVRDAGGSGEPGVEGKNTDVERGNDSMEIGDQGEEHGSGKGRAHVEGGGTCVAQGEAGSSINKMLYSANGSPVDTQELLDELSAAEKTLKNKRKKLGSTRSTRSKRFKSDSK